MTRAKEKLKGAKKRRPRRRNDVSFMFAKSMYKTLDTGLSRRLYEAIESDHSAIASCAMPDPSSYECSEAFRKDYQAYALMRKHPRLRIDTDCAAVALKKFSESETTCRETNERFLSGVTPPGFQEWSVGQVLFLAQRKIRRLLGKLDWDLLEQHFAFTSGASYDLRRKQGDPYYKFGHEKPTVTPPCLALAIAAVKRIPRWAEHLTKLHGTNPKDWFRLVPGNRVSTVAKDATTDRTIAIEPTMNMFIQKGIGGWIRERLLEVGIDLSDQTRNQKLARLGSLTGYWATVDLASASDTVALELVRWLLPPEWFEAIELTRSHYGVLPDRSLTRYEKVSSMGNAFTFELESLIFWALSESVVELSGCTDRVLVYGDDIVIPSAYYDRLVEVLSYCGFTTNAKKSFHRGPFRESCGKHYFLGRDVTPFLITDPLTTDSRIIQIANQLKRWAAGWVGGPSDATYKGSYDKLVSNIRDRRLRFPSTPDGIGDRALVGSYDECKNHCRYSRRRQLYLAYGISNTRSSFRADGNAAFLRQISRPGNAHLRTLGLVRGRPGLRHAVPSEEPLGQWQTVAIGGGKDRTGLVRFWQWHTSDPFWA